MNKQSIISLGICIGLTTFVSPARSAALTPTTDINGQTQLQLAEQWSHWLGDNPSVITDLNGSQAANGDQGSVFFLVGNPYDINGNNIPTTRNVTIQANQYLFFPLVNSIGFADFYYYDPALAPGTVPVTATTVTSEVKREMVGYLNDFSVPYSLSNVNLFATLGNISLLDSSQNYRQTSDANFPFLFGKNPAAGNFPYFAVQDGYYLALAPLQPGQYTLRFGNKTPFSQDSTYLINVQPVPVPPAIGGILLFSAVGLLSKKKLFSSTRSQFQT